MASGTCAFEGCGNVGRVTRGWCPKHYTRFLRHGDPALDRIRAACAFEGCDSQISVSHSKSGLCAKHFNAKYDAEHPETRRKAVRTYHARHVEERNQKSADRRVKYPDENRGYWRKYQAESLEGATRNAYEWTGWELELLMDQSRTARQLAATLHRTYATVVLMRHKIRTDPKTIDRAGLGDVL